MSAMKDAKFVGWLSNLVLVFAATILALVAIEFAVRLALGHSVVLFPRNHAAAQYGPFMLRTMTPGTVFWHQTIDGRWRFQTNNKGFRDTKDYAYPKQEDVFRVLVMGDSHTVGFEVNQDETFSNIIELILNERGLKAEVINTGISGMGTAEQLAYFEQEGMRYDPDLVVVSFFHNDYSDSVRAGLYRIEEGDLRIVSYRYTPGIDILNVVSLIPGTKWISENSYAYSYVFNTVWRLFKVRAIMRARDDNENAIDPSTLFEKAIVDGKITENEQELTIMLLARIANIGRKNDVITVLVDIPAVHDSNSFRNSLEPVTRSSVQSSFDYILSADDYLEDRLADELIHVPNGHRHISADTHRRLGEALASLISNTNPTNF